MRPAGETVIVVRLSFFYSSWPFSVPQISREKYASSLVTWKHACAHRELARRSFEFCVEEAQEFIGTIPGGLQ